MGTSKLEGPWAGWLLMLQLVGFGLVLVFFLSFIFISKYKVFWKKFTCFSLIWGDPEGFKDPWARDASNPAALRQHSPTELGHMARPSLGLPQEQWAQQEAEGRAAASGHHPTAPSPAPGQDLAGTSPLPFHNPATSPRSPARTGRAQRADLSQEISAAHPNHCPAPASSEMASAAPVIPLCHRPSAEYPHPSTSPRSAGPHNHLLAERELDARSVSSRQHPPGPVGAAAPTHDSSVFNTYIKKGTKFKGIKKSR